jgi:hypothetical protein
MSVRRLDDILEEDVKVMKIDIEGFELPVRLAGPALQPTHAQRSSMSRHNVPCLAHAALASS